MYSVAPKDRDDYISSRTESAVGLALGVSVTHAQGMLPSLLHWHTGSIAFKSLTSISSLAMPEPPLIHEKWG